MAPIKKSRRAKTQRNWGGGDVFVALADPTRRRIMDLLMDGDLPVHALTETFAISRPAISQHLRVLRASKLVSEQRHGRERLYRLQAGALREAAAWITRYEQFWDEHLALLGERLDQMAIDEQPFDSNSTNPPSINATTIDAGPMHETALNNTEDVL